MDEQNADSNSLFYGEQAQTSNQPISDADMALLEKAGDVEIRDGDDLVEIDTDAEGDDQGEETPEDKPEDKQKEKPAADAPIEERMKAAQSEIEEIGEALKGKGVDVDKLVESITAEGKITEEHLKTLADAGIPRAAVNALVREQQVLAQEATREFFATVGGEQQFMALSEFAVANDPEAVAAFNDAQERGDVKTAKVVLKSIERAYRAQYGSANKMVSGRPTSASKGSQPVAFSSNAEMVKAMSDPRYGKDSKYTREVEARVAAM